MFTMIYNLKLTTTVIALLIVPMMTLGVMPDVSAQKNTTGIADLTESNGVPDAAVGGSSGTNSSIGGNTSSSSETMSGNNGGEGTVDKFQ
jgi:hypothetical protein